MADYDQLTRFGQEKALCKIVLHLLFEINSRFFLAKREIRSARVVHSRRCRLFLGHTLLEDHFYGLISQLARQVLDLLDLESEKDLDVLHKSLCLPFLDKLL